MITTTITRQKKLENAPKFKISDLDIQYVSQYNYLCLILENKMSLNHWLKNVNKRVNNEMFCLRKLKRYLTCVAAILIYKQTILPIFD